LIRDEEKMLRGAGRGAKNKEEKEVGRRN